MDKLIKKEEEEVTDDVCDWFIDTRDCPIHAYTHSSMHDRELWRPLHCVRRQEGKYTGESKRMTLSQIASRYEGNEEERNCDKGCWQAVTGTTLSATRFCAYHSPRVYHHRRQCRPRPIWSDLILVILIHHPLSIHHLSSFTILLDLVALCISRARFSLPPSLVALVFFRYLQQNAAPL